MLRFTSSLCIKYEGALGRRKTWEQHDYFTYNCNIWSYLAFCCKLLSNYLFFKSASIYYKSLSCFLKKIVPYFYCLAFGLFTTYNNFLSGYLSLAKNWTIFDPPKRSPITELTLKARKRQSLVSSTVHPKQTWLDYLWRGKKITHNELPTSFFHI